MIKVFSKKNIVILIFLFCNTLKTQVYINFKEADTLAESILFSFQQDPEIDFIFKPMEKSTIFYDILSDSLKYSGYNKNAKDEFPENIIENFDKELLEKFLNAFKELTVAAHKEFKAQTDTKNYDIPKQEYSKRNGFYEAISTALLYLLLAQELDEKDYNPDKDIKIVIDALLKRNVYNGATNYTFNIPELTKEINKSLPFPRTSYITLQDLLNHFQNSRKEIISQVNQLKIILDELDKIKKSGFGSESDKHELLKQLIQIVFAAVIANKNLPSLVIGEAFKFERKKDLDFLNSQEFDKRIEFLSNLNNYPGSNYFNNLTEIKTAVTEAIEQFKTDDNKESFQAKIYGIYELIDKNRPR